MRQPSPEAALARFRTIIWALVAVVALLYLLPRLEGWLVHFSAQPRAVTPRGDLAAEEKTTIEIFQRTSPSVVYITTVERVIDPWTRNVFAVPKGTGSGFVWDEHGHIVTNYHVVEGAQSARVRLNDERAYEAVLVGASPAHDLAVLRIAVAFDRPPPVPIGSSGDLQVGQRAFAIGNPFGLDYTLTTGILSALDRTLRNEDGSVIHHLIQTDAAINPGNSGGPLIDSAGRLIGINTAIYSPSGASAGIGFAIPVDTVNRVVPELIARGRYTRPSLGIQSDERISRLASDELGAEGVLVLRVDPGSPADRAGLRGSRLASDGGLIPGDLILAVDDTQTTDVDELNAALADHAIGDTVTLTILRNGHRQTLPVALSSAR